jgi:2-polyprenyl-3-methyl-5-hydroxy-6-metoxy-1,4-benzoquinol methylase
VVRENLAYKTDDHLFRSADEYAQGKYDVTSRWLAPHVKPGQLLLNVGCGSGEYNATALAMGLRVIACEPESSAYEIARRHATDVRNCGLMELDSEPADYLVMHDVLEHIEDDAAAVERVRELLVPGGLAVISVPAYQWLFGRHDVELGHYRRYTKGGLRTLFARGFTIEVARYYGAALIPVALYYSRLSKKPYPVAAASDGVMRKAMRAVCQFESRLAMPIGTSVLLRVRRR